MTEDLRIKVSDFGLARVKDGGFRIRNPLGILHKRRYVSKRMMWNCIFKREKKKCLTFVRYNDTGTGSASVEANTLYREE